MRSLVGCCRGVRVGGFNARLFGLRIIAICCESCGCWSLGRVRRSFLRGSRNGRMSSLDVCIIICFGSLIPVCMFLLFLDVRAEISEISPGQQERAAFNDMIAYDDEWTEVAPVGLVEYGDDFDSPFIHRVLSLGLLRIHKFIKPEFRDTRRRMLPGPGLYWAFLSEALRRETYSIDDGVYLSEFTAEDNERLELDHAPFFDESDSGLADGWRWAHQDATGTAFVRSNSQIALRAQGCCMWDRARLDAWSVFQQPWEPPEYPFHREE